MFAARARLLHKKEANGFEGHSRRRMTLSEERIQSAEKKQQIARVCAWFAGGWLRLQLRRMR